MILYGPPAAGKDTISLELQQLDSRYVHFARIKVGGGRTDGYRVMTNEALQEVRASGEIIWENRRYGSVYAINRSTLLGHLVANEIPLLHLGQLEAVATVVKAFPAVRWHVIALWCPRDEAERRIVARGTSDTTTRLHAWDETKPMPNADLTINTATCTPNVAAQLIHRRVIT